MASVLQVEELRGSTTGANANKIIIPSGQTLDASAGTVVPSSGQIVNSAYSATTSGDSYSQNSNYVDLGFSTVITPTSISSKMKVTLSTVYYADHNGTVSNTQVQIRANGSAIYTKYFHYKETTVGWLIFPAHYTFVYEPNTTDQLTFTAWIKCQTNSAYIYENAQLIVEEIAG